MYCKTLCSFALMALLSGAALAGPRAAAGRPAPVKVVGSPTSMKKADKLVRSATRPPIYVPGPKRPCPPPADLEKVYTQPKRDWGKPQPPPDPPEPRDAGLPGGV